MVEFSTYLNTVATKIIQQANTYFVFSAHLKKSKSETAPICTES
jgi:hypothetical protein